MNRPKRVPKPMGQRLSDCEAHCQFLGEAVDLFPHDPLRYKQISGQLRVLVCETKTNAPLLLDLMDELGVDYRVEKEADHPVPFRLKTATGWQDTDRRPLRYRDYLNDAFSLFLGGRDWTPRELILMVSQEDGTAHEAASVDATMAMFGGFLYVGGVPAWAALLFQEGRRALLAGSALMDRAIADLKYQPRYYKTVQAPPQSPPPDGAP